MVVGGAESHRIADSPQSSYQVATQRRTTALRARLVKWPAFRAWLSALQGCLLGSFKTTRKKRPTSIAAPSTGRAARRPDRQAARPFDRSLTSAPGPPPMLRRTRLSVHARARADRGLRHPANVELTNGATCLPARVAFQGRAIINPMPPNWKRANAPRGGATSRTGTDLAGFAEV